VAFALPLAAEGIEPRCTFEVDSRASLHGVLLQFDIAMRFARAQFVLGSQIVQLGARLRHGVFHLTARGRLLAALDFRRGEAALSPHMDPGHVKEASWARRPPGAGVLPPGFVRSSPAQLSWNYLRRTERDLLPARYRQETISYRGTPRVPVSWLRDSQLAVLGELSARSAQLDALSQRTGMQAEQLSKDLASLYYAGAITTTSSKAARPTAVGERDSGPSLAPEFASVLTANDAAPFRSALTVPANLRQDSLHR
jgi:hypothetical protein